mmetsp:Transcript_26166/g.72173  ORF Transcript_26166/g.72173 Transcript_26166/m.72173 type:complete len:455 (-) Transcript_26166:1-1365(-)
MAAGQQQQVPVNEVMSFSPPSTTTTTGLPSSFSTSGTIAQRRSLGKNLAFMDILQQYPEPEKSSADVTNEPDASPSNDDDDDNTSLLLSVAFRSSSFQGGNFPTKTSMLPFGAQVQVDLRSATRSGPPWEVTSWSLTTDPRQEARQQAQEGRGLSCSKYLQARAVNYLKIASQNQPQQKKRPSTRNEKRSRQNNGEGTASDASQSQAVDNSPSSSNAEESNNGHGDAKAKSLRAKVFAQWLIDQGFFDVVDGTNDDNCVLDVAGGKGQLSMELASLAQIPCTVMDPLIRRKPPKSAWKRLQKQGAPLPRFIAQPFERPFCQEIRETASSSGSSSQQPSNHYTLLCGLHPDECTEDILQVALNSPNNNTSVAIVPCCVFPSLFPHRRMGGRPVTTYQEFLDYLLTQDDRLQRATLDFQGKNQVIYYNHRKEATVAGDGRDPGAEEIHKQTPTALL